MDSKEVIEFVIDKQIGETGSGKIYKLKTNKDGESNDRNYEKEQQRGGGVDRLQVRKSRIHRHYIRTKPGFIVEARSGKNTEFHSAKGDESSSTYKKEKRKPKRVREAID